MFLCPSDTITFQLANDSESVISKFHINCVAVLRHGLLDIGLKWVGREITLGRNIGR